MRNTSKYLIGRDGFFLFIGMVGIGLDWKYHCYTLLFGRQWSLVHPWLLLDVLMCTFNILVRSQAI